MTVLEAFKGINAYPIPQRTIEEVAGRRGVGLTADASAAVLTSGRYRLACADLYMWLSFAPDVSQGGQSYSFTDEQRLRFRTMAQAAYAELEDNRGGGVRYGYKGSRL